MPSSAENVKLKKVSSALEQLDERLKRMQEKLLPTDPYILNCPSDHRMDMRQADLWIRDTPFTRGEEHLQYVTFLARDKGDNLLRTIGAWDDGRGGMKSVLQDPKAGGRSGAASPMTGQAPKKKISLMDYKNKTTREGGARVSISRPVSPRPPSSTNGQQIAVTAIPHLPEVKVSAEEAPIPQKNLKRPAEGPLERPSPGHKTSSVEPHSPKRARTSSPAASKPSVTEKPSQNLHKVNGKHQASGPSTLDLPPLLSPTLPPVARSPRVALPPLLSPTLPPQVEAELARQASIKSQSETDGKQNRKRRAGTDQQQSAPHKQAAHSKFSKQRPNGNTEKPSAARQAAEKQEADEASVLQRTSAAPAGQNHERMMARRSLMVKLKIPPRLHKRVAIILGVVSPKRPFNGFRSEEGRAAEAREKEKGKVNSTERPKRESMASVATGKRQREDPSSPSLKAVTKRHKPVNSQDSLPKPKTPSQPPKSPEPAQNGSAKSYLSTPVKDLKSATMNRIKSSDSDVKTPLGSLRSNTPTAVLEGRPPSSTSSSNGSSQSLRSEEASALKQESARFQELGRTLKHECKDLMEKSNATEKDKKESAALAVESILCFMLTFRLLDECNRITYRLSGDRSSWRSLLPLLGQTRRTTTAYPYIFGLGCQIEAICRDLIHELDVEHLCSNRSANPRDDLLDNMRQSSRMWALGLSNLSKESLRNHFGETWNAQAKTPTPVATNSPGKNREKLVAKQYREEGYYLPLGPTSTVMEVVRFGLKVLDEWTEKEGLEWQSRMGI